MIFDKQNMYSDKQTLASAVSTNIIDGGAAGDAYEALFLAVTVNPPLSGAQSLVVDVLTSATSDMASPVTLATFRAKTGAGLAIGERFPHRAKRYTQLKYTVTGATGTVTAGLTPDIPTR